MEAKYVGKNGEYIGGVPMRDLSEDDWSQLDADQRKLVRGSKLYEVQSKAEPEASGKKEA